MALILPDSALWESSPAQVAIVNAASQGGKLWESLSFLLVRLLEWSDVDTVVGMKSESSEEVAENLKSRCRTVLCTHHENF